MSKGRGKIDPKDGEATQFQPGQSGNPYGRPTKLVSQVLKDLKEAGAEAVSPGQVSDVISVLLNLPKDMITKIAADQKLPILVQRTARRFVGSSDKDWDWVLSNNLDRAHGKAVQKTDVSGDLKINGGGEMTKERIAALKTLLGKNDD